MMKHRSKKQSGSGPEQEKQIGSAEDFKKHVGRISDKVKTHSLIESAGAKDFAGKVGRVSDRLHDPEVEERRRMQKHERVIAGIGAAVAVWSVLVYDPAAIRQDVKTVKSTTNAEVINLLHSEQTSKHQAMGESVSSGLPTTQAVAKINIDKIRGNSYLHKNGHLYELQNSWSAQFNINLGIITKNAGGKTKNPEVLWLQNAFSSYKGKATITSEIYHGTVHIAREMVHRDKEVNWDLISVGLLGNAAKEEALPVDILRGISGRGKVSDDSKIEGNDTYEYTRPIAASTDKVHIALDIRTAVKGPHEVEISFGYAPIGKNGNVNWKKETTFDNVTYHVKGTVVSANMGFSKVYDAGLTIDGYADGEFFYAQKLSGTLGMYEEEKGKLKALPVSGFKDYSTAEYTYNVKSVIIHKGTVRIGTSANGTKKQASDKSQT